MGETNEAEVLKATAVDAWNDGPEGEPDAFMLDRVARAVAAKARELDRARGGTLSAETMAVYLDTSERATDYAWSRDTFRKVLLHAAAQGRTIAEKDARIAELERMSALDEERIGQAKKNRGEALMRAKAAESALATLRQAVETEIFNLRRVGLRGNTDRLKAALDATPAEHPDTATPILGVSRLGDSGPSGGGCKTCGHTDPKHAVAHRDLCGAECPCAKPTTPPDVAASEDPTCCENGGRVTALCRIKCFDDALPITTEATPTPEEDWRTVGKFVLHSEECAGAFGPCTCGADAVVAALARLRDEPRRAAEDMRKRCIVSIHLRAGYIAPEDERRDFAAKLVRDIEALKP